MKKRMVYNCMIFIIILIFPFCAHSSLFTGELISTTNSAGNANEVYLGDGTSLYTSWSVRCVWGCGPVSVWFYGTESTLDSNTDFYIYGGLTDPTTISDATIFSYSTTPEWTYMNSTVFFKGTDGNYGAWVLKNLIGIEGDIYHDEGTLYVDWYYLNDGTGDFTQNPIPIPSAVWLLGSGLIGVVGIRMKFGK